MTKAEMIERHGVEYYENFKERQRNAIYNRYHADVEKARARNRRNDANNREHKREYARNRREIYRINSRDAVRLAHMGIVKEGQEVHHLKYHRDANDPAGIDDIVIMSREEHRAWHHEHPEFNALDHVV